jgi:DNA polymerase III alpha subunit
MISTGYSFRAAVGHLSDVINRLKAINWQVAPVADRCSTFAYVRWTKQAKAAGLRPIYGVELAVTPAAGIKKPPLDYWVFLAKNDVSAVYEAVRLATEYDGKEAILT